MSKINKVTSVVVGGSRVLHNPSSVMSSNNPSQLSLDELDAVSGGGLTDFDGPCGGDRFERYCMCQPGGCR